MSPFYCARRFTFAIGIESSVQFRALGIAELPGVWFADDAIPQILCEQYPLGRTELKCFG